MKTIAMDGGGKNALGTVMMTWLLAELEAANGAPVLLTGTADAFSAGLDLREVAGHDATGMLHYLTLLERCMTALFLYPGPTVAAVNGHAIAGGCVLTLCCDHRVMTRNERSRIGLNEVALGVRFPPRVMALVKQRVPQRHLSEIILGAALYPPEAALRLGLVDELADDVIATGTERLATFAKHPKEAYALAKVDLRGTEDDLYPSAAHEAHLRDLLAPWTSIELKDRVQAVLARR